MNALKINLIFILSTIPLYTAEPTTNFSKTFVFYQTKDTLNKIMDVISKREKGVYLRFGDGDLFLAGGGNDSFQAANNNLGQELQEALSMNGPNILKALPIHCRELGGWEEGMFLPGNHENSYDFCVNLLTRANQFWNAPITELYSPVAIHLASTSHTDFCINFLKFLRGNNCALLVGNVNIPPYLRNLLFGEQCAFVPTPAQNSYDEIDRIEKECLEKIPNNSDYKIIITSMGCSGRALQKRLWRKVDNIFLFDFGSLMDALCGWNTRWWIRDTHFNAPQFLAKLTKELKA